MSPEEVEERRKKAGLCPTCGEVQTHRLNMLMNKVPVVSVINFLDLIPFFVIYLSSTLYKCSWGFRTIYDVPLIGLVECFCASSSRDR